jgi:hypothetical protein
MGSSNYLPVILFVGIYSSHIDCYIYINVLSKF